MNSKPVSIGLGKDMRRLMLSRMKQDQLGQSEYFRKCMREEAERARAKRMLLLNPSLLC